MPYKIYESRFLSACRQRGWKVRRKKADPHTVMWVKVNEGARKRVCFSAGIHGDERAGPEAVLRFVEEAEVPDDVTVLLLPVVNPWGFSQNRRANALRQDVNRRFCDRLLTGEAKAVYGTLARNPVDLFCSLHEWSGRDGFYMYASDRSKDLSGIPRIASDWFTLFTDRDINGEPVDGGIIWHPQRAYSDTKSKCTLENRMFMGGTHYICLETPSRARLEDRTECQLAIMKHIVSEIV